VEDSLYYIQSRPDVQIDPMGEFVLGKIGLFVNAENMRTHPLSVALPGT
jgi:hypothetical protein